jgi:hypothetical protein
VGLLAKQTDDWSKLVASTANRLRLIQIDFADAPAEDRRGYLSEAVEAALAAVVPERREALLRELMTRFPTWDPNVEVTAPQEEAGVQSRTDERELQDPAFLVERLIDVASELSDDERAAVTQRLCEAGLAPEAEGGWPEEPMKRVREALGLKGEEPLDARRTLGLLATLAEFACVVDPLVWKQWGRLAPESQYQSIATLRHILAQYCTGEENVSDDRVTDDLLKLRHLILAMVVALREVAKIASKDVASSFLASIAPAKIEDLVKFEKGSIFVSPEVKCWRKYKDLAGTLSDAAVEEGIREKVERFVEELMKRRQPVRH